MTEKLKQKLKEKQKINKIVLIKGKIQYVI